MGCRTEPAAVHIAHVLHFFQFFNFFYILHDLPQKKTQLHALTTKKKLHDSTNFLYTSCIFHCM